MRFFSLVILFGALPAWGQVSYVPPTQVLRDRGTQLSLGLEGFQTAQTVDQDGKKEKLADGSSFSRYQGEINGLFGLTNDFNGGIGVRYRHQTSTFTNGTEKVNATGTGVQSLNFRLLFGFQPVNRTRFTLEGNFRFVPYTNDEVDGTSDRDKLALGDEGNEYSLGAGMTYSSLSQNHLTLRGGWRRPGNELSTEFYWNGEVAFQFRHLAPVLGVDGVTSLKNSKYESDPNDRPDWNTGASALYNSINREWIAPYAGLNIAFSNVWRVELRGFQVISGRSTDLGTGFGINIVRRMDETSEKVVDAEFKSYDLEATVTKISDKKTYVVIDRGLSDDVEKGMRFDFFEFDYVGGNTLVARGVVIKVSSDKAIVKLTHRFNLAREIKEGLVGRASLK